MPKTCARIAWRSFASRRENGSSRSSAFGSARSVRASATREAWPPDSVAGRDRRIRKDRSSSSIASALALLSRLASRPTRGIGEHQIAADGHVRIEQRVLEQEPDPPTLRRHPVEADAVQMHVAGRGEGVIEEAGDHREQRRLAGARRAHDGQHLAGPDRPVEPDEDAAAERDLDRFEPQSLVRLRMRPSLRPHAATPCEEQGRQEAGEGEAEERQQRLQERVDADDPAVAARRQRHRLRRDRRQAAGARPAPSADTGRPRRQSRSRPRRGSGRRASAA